MAYNVPDQQVQTVIEYVNDRNGNRPPSLKCQGTYYTISDAALDIAQAHKGQRVTLSFYINRSGYHVATAINGQSLPKDNRQGGGRQGGSQPYQQPQQQAAPPTQYAPPSQQAPSGGLSVADIASIRMQSAAQVAAAAITAGLTLDQYQAWMGAVLHVARHGVDRPQVQPPQQHSAPPQDDLNDEIPF